MEESERRKIAAIVLERENAVIEVRVKLESLQAKLIECESKKIFNQTAFSPQSLRAYLVRLKREIAELEKTMSEKEQELKRAVSRLNNDFE